MLLAVHLVDERHACRLARIVHSDLADHRVWQDVEVAALQSRTQKHGARIKRRADRAAAMTIRRKQAPRPHPHILGQQLLCLRIVRMQFLRDAVRILNLGQDRAMHRHYIEPQLLLRVLAGVEFVGAKTRWRQQHAG